MQTSAELDSRAWGRATLVAGRSRVQAWSVDSARAHTQLVVGRRPANDWCIEADGMEEEHCVLLWSRQTLWVIPSSNAVTLVNREPLRRPLKIARTCWLELGAAVLIVDASPGRAANGESTSAPASAGSTCPTRAFDRTLIYGLPQAPLAVAAEPSTLAATALTSQPSRLDAPELDAVRTPPHPHADLTCTRIAPLGENKPHDPEAWSEAIDLAMPRLGRAGRPHHREPGEPGSNAAGARGLLGASYCRLLANLPLTRARRLFTRLVHGRVRALLWPTMAGFMLLVCMQVVDAASCHSAAGATADMASGRARAAERPSGNAAKRDALASPSVVAARPPAPTPDRSLEVNPAVVRRASALLLAGRHEQALPLYQQLAKDDDQPVFQLIARVLSQRLREQCLAREGDGGEPCEP